MKKVFIASMLIAFATICSCQKQDSTAEAQFEQRKTELDARETALDEREKALDARERALAEKENAIANTSTIRPERQSQRQISNAAEAKAERDRRIQQLPPEFQALVPDAQVKADSGREKGKASNPMAVQPEKQLRPEDLDRQWQRKLDKANTSAAEFAPKPDSGETEAASPSPSTTPQ